MAASTAASTRDIDATQMPQKPLKALGFAVLIWIVGFVWGSVVFMTPALKATPPIPYISNNPAISFPILLIWIPLIYFLARAYLSRVNDPDREGFKLGLIFAGTNFILDLVVLVLLLKAGAGYFAAASIWFAYFLLLIIPWLTGRSLQKALP
ncbi:MAG TPA: hypothetical protein VFX97_15160 [Pyrinomonadaceae bacterium]|nr:hypothetical protein [Pyrinomonadaceae bacterium]